MGTLLHESHAHSPYLLDYPNKVKTEASASPDLSPLQHFQFKFHSSHDNLYRWPASTVSHIPARLNTDLQNYTISSHSHHNQNHNHHHSSQQPMSYSDDYDDIADMPPSAFSGPGASSNDRNVRRRSSKACDQCRKSKCKCERSGPNEPCKSCIMLGTPCTFLGPSRKRGPPKGYIDAIEARLHQTEALLGIMLATNDPRAQSLLQDISKDSLAKEIIARVDNSPYGIKGRKRQDIALSIGGKARSGHSSETSQPGQKSESKSIDLTSTHPSNEWQDRVSAMLNSLQSGSSSDQATGTRHDRTYSPKSSSDGNGSPDGRRQRRRIGDEDYPFHHGPSNFYSNSAPGSAVSLHQFTDKSRGTLAPISPAQAHLQRNARDAPQDRRSSSAESMTSESEDEFVGAVGQLSLNEDEQVRYHGKASGLHLLGTKERVDRRNEGGIWRFPKARVWPPLPSGSTTLNGDDELVSKLPPPQVQEHLIDLYFTHVHPHFPIIHKRAFFAAYKATSFPESPESPEPELASSSSPFGRRSRRIPTLLLFSMFAIASRYDETTTPLPSDPSMMWEAGDEFLNHAKVILDSTYASSRPSTCQSLLLMGFREIGIGAMAQSWTYIGMAIRMAQDLGMHRSADGWERTGLGGRLFSEWELNERKRIWFGCVIMDKYVSTYIGRPLMIFERDFDTALPSEQDTEEFEELKLSTAHGEIIGMPGRIISCFNASACLSGLLSMIVQGIYAVRPPNSRHSEAELLEKELDKWYLALPEQLRYEPGASKPGINTLPNVLTLHMQYWCAVLLLHRPFIRHVVQQAKNKPEESDDPDLRALATKSYELCNAAANHITSIVSQYQERYSLIRAPVFLCYYVFTASIMHDTTLTVHPNDPQARLGLSKCMSALRAMQVVWPSAARALELFRGAKTVPGEDVGELLVTSNQPERNKRAAEGDLDDSFNNTHPSTIGSSYNNSYLPTLRHNVPPAAQSHGDYSSHTPGTGTSVYTGAGYIEPQHAPVATAPGMSSSSMINSGYWHAGDIASGDLNAPISTAVMPQLYSTGMDTSVPPTHSRMHSDQHSQSSTHSRRYQPQFWNEYQSYPQFGSQSYDIQNPVHMGQPAHPQAHHQQQQQQQPQQSPTQTQPMYLPEHYNLYNLGDSPEEPPPHQDSGPRSGKPRAGKPARVLTLDSFNLGPKPEKRPDYLSFGLLKGGS
ncbi:hypothetical protein CVT24_012500 [Panaeolus cyanescens]|uniref:Zn(2)-C6 fungal-type domain-containing protein n=1 Tax=Panaeolus cyanescens TaxID=181874 RepID=A0A409YK42_9AGAR|nr:hypothetical protein CVT24_012500 [Panaeolus cyanescens]